MIRHIFNEAFSALSHYRLRSCLTMLSIVWGVVSLVLLLAYGQGFEKALVKAFQQIGKDLVVAFPGQTSMQAGGERSGRRIMLELADVKAIQDGVPTVEAISPEVRRRFPIAFGYRTRDYSISGVYADYGRIRNMEMVAGRFLNQEDVLQRQRVVVIGENIRKELFSGMPALGAEVKVLRKKTQISNYAAPDDMTAYVPFTTFSGMVNSHYIDNIVMLPVSNQFRNRIVEDVRAALARTHNFNLKDERAVTIIEWNKFLAMIQAISVGLQVLLGIIGTFTLSIGAVGVVNIMLVSVTERTREIGVLKALGAPRRLILGQILTEGLLLTVAGGVVGFIVSTVLLKLIGSMPFLGAIFEDTSGQGDIHLLVSFSALLTSTSILVLVGLIAGMIPAVRAARLDPVQAIRSE
jgi:putative ABC transport system permease protein